MAEEIVRYEITSPKVTLVTVFELPDVDPTYTSVLLRIWDEGCGTFQEWAMSGPNAQRIGQALNTAGGGLPATINQVGTS